MLGAVAVVTTAGCFTGPRPSFADPSGDPAIDDVLTLLDRAGSTPFTASYSILTRSNGATTQASVTVSPPAERSITIGDVRFLTVGDTVQTCALPAGPCTPGVAAEQVSDVQVAPEFYATAAAAQLRADAAASTQPAADRTEVVSGQQATCVDVTLAGGTKTYCVLDSGVLARLDAGGTAVLIELVSYAPQADESLLAAPS